MPSSVKWLIKDHVIAIEYVGNIAIDDAIKSTSICKEWLQSTTNQVHLINDLTTMEGLSPEFQKVGQIFGVTRDFMSMDNLGMMVGYGTENKMVKFLTNMVGQLGKANFSMFDSYDLAIEHIMHNDPKLRELLPTQGA